MSKQSNIIKMDGVYYYIHDMKSYEDYGSCCYDRVYKVVRLSELDKKVTYVSTEISTIEVRGVTVMPFSYHSKYAYVKDSSSWSAKNNITYTTIKRKKLKNIE